MNKMNVRNKMMMGWSDKEIENYYRTTEKLKAEKLEPPRGGSSFKLKDIN